jgi:signal transduction histidine kinase
MVDEDARPTVPQLAELRVVWDAVLAMCSSFRVERAPEIRVEKAELRELVRSIRGGADVRRVESMVGSWRYERAEARMLALRDQLTSVASRLGKGAIEVSITPTTLRLPPRRWHNFWSVFGHVVRNAVDHGLEEPAARRACGKADNGLIRMSFELREDLVEFRFGDDGPGIDWERVASKALSLGLACSSREDLENAIFSDSMSTRDEATETSGRGVGMGAVRAVVRAEGGLIRIESVRDVGTTWVFVFPRTMLAAEEPLLSDPPRAVSASPERRRSRNPHATSVT